jgi:hypothetical protein
VRSYRLAVDDFERQVLTALVQAGEASPEELVAAVPAGARSKQRKYTADAFEEVLEDALVRTWVVRAGEMADFHGHGVTPTFADRRYELTDAGRAALAEAGPSSGRRRH